jgi:glycosyltransferase involved in cell wall biosynthesis
MVVGVLTCSYPRFAGDAAGSFVADDVRRLTEQGCTVEVVAAGDGPAGVARAREGDVTVTRISSGERRAGALFYGDGAPETLERRGARAWLAAAHFTAALCREVRAAAVRWDSIVSHWLVPCALSALASAPGLPHRGVAHSGDVALLERIPFGHALARRLADAGVELTFVSEDLRRRFAALAGRCVGRVELLAPDTRLFHPVSAAERRAARERLGFERPTVLSVGRLVPIKGFDLLIDAVADGLPDAGSAVDLVILGAGPEEAALRARARRRGVGLRLPGFVPREGVPAWLAAADLYVQPSRVLPSGRTEGVPIATLEALAVGLPVIASRSGGLAELAAEGRRVSFCAPNDIASLRASLAASGIGRGVPLV